jgi:hypothetical protein
MVAPPDDPDRKRLTADLIATYFGAYADLAEGSGEGYVPSTRGWPPSPPTPSSWATTGCCCSSTS